MTAGGDVVRSPVEQLTPDEAAMLRDVVLACCRTASAERGIAMAARRFGLDERTLLKAAVGAPVHRLTAALIRERLGAS